MSIEQHPVAVVTGGASGIGFGLAEAVGARGGRVVVADIRPDAVASAVDRLRGSGVEVVGEVVDVADAGSVEALAATALDAFGRVDLVANNAGLVSPDLPMWEQDLATWRRLIDVKVHGVVNGVRAFAPILIRQGRGHILNTASSGGLAPLPGRTPYTATMHAVVGLTETLDLELKRVSADLGATVLAPGLVDTPLGQNSAALGAIDPPKGTVADLRALGMDVLSPRDVAERTLAAIEAGRVHVAPGADVLPRARARVDALLGDLEAAADGRSSW